METRKFAILNGNHLKLIAAVTMLLDHAGILLFPKIALFRILGRLTYPVFAYMIAEGCRYTRNKLRYFLLVFGLGAACQIVYYFFSKDTYLNILLTFSCSILLIYTLQASYKADTWQKRALWSILFCAGFLSAYVLDQRLTIDYGFWGIMAPVFVAFAHLRKFPHWASVLMLGVALMLLTADMGGIQHYSLLSLPLLLLYSGKRGKCKMKYFFYIFYPVHLVVLQGITMLIERGGL